MLAFVFPTLLQMGLQFALCRFILQTVTELNPSLPAICQMATNVYEYSGFELSLSKTDFAPGAQLPDLVGPVVWRIASTNETDDRTKHQYGPFPSTRGSYAAQQRLRLFRLEPVESFTLYCRYFPILTSYALKTNSKDSQSEAWSVVIERVIEPVVQEVFETHNQLSMMLDIAIVKITSAIASATGDWIGESTMRNIILHNTDKSEPRHDRTAVTVDDLLWRIRQAESAECITEVLLRWPSAEVVPLIRGDYEELRITECGLFGAPGPGFEYKPSWMPAYKSAVAPLAWSKWALENCIEDSPETRKREQNLLDFLEDLTLRPDDFVHRPPDQRAFILAKIDNRRQPPPEREPPPDWLRRCIAHGLARPNDDGDDYVWTSTFVALAELYRDFEVTADYSQLTNLIRWRVDELGEKRLITARKLQQATDHKNGSALPRPLKVELKQWKRPDDQEHGAFPE